MLVADVELNIILCFKSLQSRSVDVRFSVGGCLEEQPASTGTNKKHSFQIIFIMDIITLKDRFTNVFLNLSKP